MKTTLFDQAYHLLKLFHSGVFASWHKELANVPQLRKWLYANGYLKPVTPECKQSCIEATKRHFLAQGKEIGTEAVRGEMNDHYLTLVEEFMMVEYLEGMTQIEADNLLRKLKTLDNQ